MSSRPPATAPEYTPSSLPPIEAPFNWLEDVARPEWMDGNGHMSALNYANAFAKAMGALLRHIDLGEKQGIESRRGVFLLDWHIAYVREVLEGARLTFPTRIVDMTDKAIHYHIEMRAGEEQYLAAVSESIELHMDLDARRPTPFSPETFAWFQEARAAHAALGPPVHSGRAVRIKRKGN
jgi:acyl-CoA thioester hydrolase